MAALDGGADDYITKPFSMDELLARLRAAVRGGGDVRLTPTEWHRLEILVTSPERLIMQKHLLQEVWGSPRATRPTDAHGTRQVPDLTSAHRAATVGVGLAVARGFVEAIRGTPHAEETPGGGLTMVLTLAMAASHPPSPEPDLSPTAIA
ncbi:UNVERIFIED_CONTAM: hypothetical protein RKD50_008656 [Streptomyces canus]